MKFDLIGIMNKATLYMKQHGPEIMVFCGAAGTVTAGVMACCETTHLPEVKQKTKKRLNSVRTMEETDPARGRMMTKAYLENGLEYVKLYAPSCIVGTLSIKLDQERGKRSPYNGESLWKGERNYEQGRKEATHAEGEDGL